MSFSLFGLFKKKSTAEDVVMHSAAETLHNKQWPPTLIPQEEWDKIWPESQKREAQSQIAFRLGVILYEKHPNIPDTEQNDYAYDIADFFSKYEDARSVMTRIADGEHPSQILQDLKKNINMNHKTAGLKPPAL